MYCSKCGKEILDESNFCNICGIGLRMHKEGQTVNAISPLVNTEKPVKGREFIAPWIVYGLFSILIAALSLGRVSIEYQDFLASIGLRIEIISTPGSIASALVRKPNIPLYEPNYIGLLAYIIIGLIFAYCIEKAMANQTPNK